MKTVKDLENMIISTIQDTCGVEITDRNQHLLSDAVKIPTVDYLYVFDSLEKQLNIPVTKVLEQNDYTVFTVHNLACEIEKMMN